MSTLGCAEKIVARGKVDKDEAKQILADVRAMRNSGKDLTRMAASKAAFKDSAAASRRLRSVINARSVIETSEQIAGNGGAMMALKTIQSRLYDVQFPLKHAVPSSDSLHKGFYLKWQSAMNKELHDLGLSHLVRTGAVDKDLAHGIYGTASTKTGKDGGGAIRVMLDHIKTRLNQYGAGIDDIADYLGDISFDYDQLRGPKGFRWKTSEADAFDRWWKAERPRMDQSTFDFVVPQAGETMADAEKRLGKEVFSQRLRGTHLIFNDTPRIMIHWKDADSWLAHMKEFGGGKPIYETVGRFMNSSARRLAVAKNFGASPANTLERMITEVNNKYGLEHIDTITNFNKNAERLRTMMGRLDGSLDTPVRSLGGKLAQSLRAFEVMAHLGNVGITHFASVNVTAPSEAVHHGIGRGQAMANLYGALFGSLKGADKEELVANLDAFHHGSLADIMQRFQTDEIPGRIQALAALEMKLTGVQYVFENAQSGFKAMLAKNLAFHSTKDFATLPPELAQMLRKYGITEGDWEVLRTAPQHIGYITAQEALGTDASKIEALLRVRNLIDGTTSRVDADLMIGKYRQDMSDKLMSYFSDAASRSVVSPNLLTRTTILGASRPGTVEGEFRRFVGQFKGWPIAVMQQVLARDAMMSLSRGKAIYNIGMLTAFSTVMGFGRLTINQLIKGQAPPDFRNPEELLKAMAMGGGLGILGDELFHQVNVGSLGYASSFAGPVIGDAFELNKIYNEFKEDMMTYNPNKKGRFHNLWPSLVRFSSNKMPFGNLFFTKGVLDYALWYHVLESADPGWWERTNQRLIKESGKGLPGYMRSGKVPYAPYGLGGGQ